MVSKWITTRKIKMSKCKDCHHNCHCNGDLHADEYGTCTCDNCKCNGKRTYNDQYDCFMEGYNQSILKMEEIGRKEINEHEIYIRFICGPNEEKPEQET